uniref:Transcription cofactor vestigial-like protein 2 n=1 Tax=Anopheles epiroticus TaxID=199890 RepID=A0A182PFQ7_9DIPT
MQASRSLCNIENPKKRPFNQDLYSSSGVPLAASSSTSAGSHSPCSPLLPPSLPSNMAAAAAAAQSSSALTSSATVTSVNQTAIPTIPLGALQRHITKEEDISTARSDTEGTISGAHNDSSCSSGPDSPHNLNQQQADASGLAAAAAAAAAAVAGGSGESSGGGGGGGGHMAGASGSGNSRAQYVSATCVVFTHYSGDAASVVDEHFSRALNFSDKNNKGKCGLFSSFLSCQTLCTE